MDYYQGGLLAGGCRLHVCSRGRRGRLGTTVRIGRSWLQCPTWGSLFWPTALYVLIISLRILPTERRVQQCTRLGCHVLGRDRNALVHSKISGYAPRTSCWQVDRQNWQMSALRSGYFWSESWTGGGCIREVGAKIHYTSNHIVCLDFVWIATQRPK